MFRTYTFSTYLSLSLLVSLLSSLLSLSSLKKSRLKSSRTGPGRSLLLSNLRSSLALSWAACTAWGGNFSWKERLNYKECQRNTYTTLTSKNFWIFCCIGTGILGNSVENHSNLTSHCLNIWPMGIVWPPPAFTSNSCNSLTVFNKMLRFMFDTF